MAQNQGGYDNKNRGAIFTNKNKVAGDNRPDYTGKLDVEGRELRVSGWWKQSNQTGEWFMSLSVQEPQAKGAGGQQQRRPASAPPGPPSSRPAPPPVEEPGAFKDDDIPF